MSVDSETRRKHARDNAELFADESDVDLTEFQRQLRVNKFMVDVKARDMVQKQLEPVYEH